MNDFFDVRLNIPLEVRLKQISEGEDAQNLFPHSGYNRFQLYSILKQKIYTDYLRDVDSGLTADTKGAAFTHHDISHVDDLIRRAGELIGFYSEAKQAAMFRLKPYELFVLLVACLIHDAGNILGRKGHAQRARGILRNVASGMLDQREISIISKIAQAHGGETTTGSRDTIGELPLEDGVENSSVRPQLLAAILRFSDELAENFRRSSRRHSPDSEFPNLFCSVVSPRIEYDSRRINLDFTISDDVCGLYGKNEDGHEMYFLDYVRQRVIKTELERRYCDRFLRGFATYDRVRVNIDFIKDDHEWKNINFELLEDGYPNSIDLSDRAREFLDGKTIADTYEQKKQEATKKNA